MHTSLTPALRRLGVGVLAAGASGALLVVGPAGSAAPAASTVTIQAQGTDLSGVVKSSRRACKAERKVIVMKQIGSRGGGDDIKFASDTTSLSGGVGVWSTGNTGTAGKFYAKIKKTSLCKGDTSPTIRAKQSA